MTDLQRIFVVSVQAGASDVAALRGRLGRDVVVVTAPTAEARRVVDRLVEGLGHEPVPDVLLAPVRFPDVDRGHRLDDLVRRHAVADRWRDVVVVTDPATVTLLLRVLAPGQLASGGPVTEVGLPRSARPVSLVRSALVGAGLALLWTVLPEPVPLWLLPLLVVVAGLALLAVPRVRHLGELLLIALGIGVLVSLMALAGSSRFPGAW